MGVIGIAIVRIKYVVKVSYKKYSAMIICNAGMICSFPGSSVKIFSSIDKHLTSCYIRTNINIIT